MIYHFVVGDVAAAPLAAAIQEEPSMQGQVVVIKDLLHIGPLQKTEGQPFSALRSSFWQQVAPNEKHPVQVDDMERLLSVSAEMYKDETISAWFWMAPWSADVSAYYWILPYLSKHLNRFYIVNIAGLPFLDANGKIFYPKNISEISPKELIKARKLARQVTPSEMEVDTDEWEKLVEENAGIRVHEGGKKLVSKDADFYDNQLLSFCSHQFQKASKIVRQTLSKCSIPTGDLYLAWRIRQLAAEGKIVVQGDSNKALNEFDIRLPGELSEQETDSTQTAAS